MRTYFETHSFVEVSRLFRERFLGTQPPNKTTIFRNVKNILIMVRVWIRVQKNLVAGKLVDHKRILTLYKKSLKKILRLLHLEWTVLPYIVNVNFLNSFNFWKSPPRNAKTPVDQLSIYPFKMGNTMVLQPYYASSCIKIDFNPFKLGFFSRVAFFLGHPVYKVSAL